MKTHKKKCQTAWKELNIYLLEEARQNCDNLTLKQVENLATLS